MFTDRVPIAMVEAYRSNMDLPLAERVVAALEGAEKAGGDIRGKQSSVLIVVSGDPDQPVWLDKIVNLRVDDHTDPLKELTRLLKVHRAYEHMNQGDFAVEEGDMKGALEEYASAEALMPESMEMKFWKAVTLANNGKIDDAVIILQKVYLDDKGQWKELLKRLPDVNLLTVSASDYELLLNSK